MLQIQSLPADGESVVVTDMRMPPGPGATPIATSLISATCIVVRAGSYWGPSARFGLNRDIMGVIAKGVFYSLPTYVGLLSAAGIVTQEAQVAFINSLPICCVASSSPSSPASSGLTRYMYHQNGSVTFQLPATLDLQAYHLPAPIQVVRPGDVYGIRLSGSLEHPLAAALPLTVGFAFQPIGIIAGPAIPNPEITAAPGATYASNSFKAEIRLQIVSVSGNTVDMRYLSTEIQTSPGAANNGPMVPGLVGSTFTVLTADPNWLTFLVQLLSQNEEPGQSNVMLHDVAGFIEVNDD